MGKPNLKQKSREWSRIQRELKKKQKKSNLLNGGEGITLDHEKKSSLNASCEVHGSKKGVN